MQRPIFHSILRIKKIVKGRLSNDIANVTALPYFQQLFRHSSQMHLNHVTKAASQNSCKKHVYRQVASIKIPAVGRFLCKFSCMYCTRNTDQFTKSIQHRFIDILLSRKVSEYDQEIPPSHTSDQPAAMQGRATEN